MACMGQLLGWPKAKAAVLAAGIHAVYAYERLGGWRRMVSLTTPQRRDALGVPPAEMEGGPATSAPEFA
jgi:hypothetical protein